MFRYGYAGAQIGQSPGRPKVLEAPGAGVANSCQGLNLGPLQEQCVEPMSPNSLSTGII